MKHVFVLSGGSIRGAWQTGALISTLTKLNSADTVAATFGVSVGSLNTAFLASAVQNDGATDVTIASLTRASVNLEQFWRTKVKGPGSLVNERSPSDLVQSIPTQGPGPVITATGWRGLVDHKPLWDIYDKAADPSKIIASKYPVFVGYTDYVTGKYFTKDLSTLGSSPSKIKFFVFASAVTPLIMDYLAASANQDANNQGVHRLSDGGLRHVIPAREVVNYVTKMITQNEPANNIHVHVIVCSPKDIGTWMVDKEEVLSMGKRPGLIDVIERAFSMMAQAVVEADIYKLQSELGKLQVGVSVVQSEKEYLQNSITDFTSADIDAMINAGKQQNADIV
ncbi:MAG: patatin-like phospholipase family protein [Ignavibacteria bacterium]|nr:patatin-like phospholipase family protein [Ignavibacteria bacterium]